MRDCARWRKKGRSCTKFKTSGTECTLLDFLDGDGKRVSKSVSNLHQDTLTLTQLRSVGKALFRTERLGRHLGCALVIHGGCVCRPLLVQLEKSGTPL